ncbi:MAG: extracellular solute-binding protein [Phormidesmis sp.]
MIDRRGLLRGSVGIAVGSLLAGCGANAADALIVLLLEGAMPSVVLKKFQQQSDTPVKFRTAAQVQTVFQTLQRWQQPEVADSWRRFTPWRQQDQPTTVDNLVSLGDYWLESAIAQDLIQPLSIPATTLELLPEKWQAFGRRDRAGKIDPAGELWAVPYKLQPLAIVYRHSQFSAAAESEKQPFSSWQDLLAPGLKESIALPSHPNIILSLLQKLRTGSFNPTDADSAAKTDQLVARLNRQLATSFAELKAQVKTYDSDTALKALINEDVKVVVGWAGDVAIALKRYQDLRVAVPDEGSLLSADMWVQPKGTVLSDTAKAWIAFCWQQGPATELSIAQTGISPIFLAEEATIPDALEETQLSLQALKRSELLLPFSQTVQTAYMDFWQELASKPLD